MFFIYTCRHCKHVIGELNKESFSQSKLGFDQLSSIEKKEMINQQKNGDVYIQSICESCEETLDHHPQYYELDFFIQ